MLRRFLFSAVLMSFAAAATLDAGTASSFVGKWQIDKKKTQAVGAPDDLQIEFKENGSKLLTKSKYREPKNNTYPLLWLGVMTYELELATDGSEKSNQIGPFMHTSKTMVDGNKMTTDFTANLEKGTVSGQWIRTLSADGKELTWQIKSEASDGRKLDQTLVFKRD